MSTSIQCVKMASDAPASFLGYRGFRHLKLSLAGLAAAVVAFVYHEPIGGRSGDTAVGYALGALAAVAILWLLWFGVRKRSYRPGTADLRGWLSAHVYLGASLLFLVPLHSAGQFGWNVHSLAYAVMTAAILSGMAGTAAYAAIPALMTTNRGGRRFDSLLEEIAELEIGRASCRERV